MSEPAMAVAQPAAQRQATRLGSFLVGPRVIDAHQRLGKVVLFAVSGSPESSRHGTSGFAYCTSLGEPAPEQLELAKAVLGRIAALCGPTLVPVLETGVAGRIGFVVEAAVSGERLSDRITRLRALPPSEVVSIAATVGSALDLAHRQRISHGMVVPTAIWVGDPGVVTMGGFGLSGRGPARDQEMLAALCLESLSGSPWKLDATQQLSQTQLVERIRGMVHGLTESLAAVFARGLAADPAARFPSVLEFSDTLRRVVQESAAEVAAGAWEAISRRDMAMAELLTEMTAGYNPGSPEVDLLRLRLRDGDSGSGARLSEAPLMSMESLIKASAVSPAPQLESVAQPAIAAPVMPADSADPVGHMVPASTDELRQSEPSMVEDPSTVAGVNPGTYDEAELRKLFAPEPIVIEPPKGNPWVIFLTVVFAMIALMTVLAAIMFTRS